MNLPKFLPASGSIVGIAVVAAAVSGLVVYLSNNVGPVKSIIGPKG